MPPPALPTDPKILVAGPGALGGFVAARLGRRWSGVHLLDHREDRAAQLQDRGLHVAGVTLADWTPPPGRVRAAVRGWPLMDVVLFFIKAPAFDAVWKTIRPVVGPKTALVVFPEAVDPAVVLKGLARQTVAALTDIRARVEGLGRVFQESPGATLLDAAAPLARTVETLLHQASIPTSLDKKVPEKRWATLLAQVCVDVPAALTDAPQSKVLQPPLASLEEKLLEECVAAAKALGRPVAAAAVRARRDALIERAPQAKSPLGRDLLRGRPTETDHLLSPLIAAAKKKKVPVPLLEFMGRLLLRLEKEPALP
jgi:2-dehydropantoate 2-reductase